jgi:hypothetical protein
MNALALLEPFLQGSFISCAGLLVGLGGWVIAGGRCERLSGALLVVGGILLLFGAIAFQGVLLFPGLLAVVFAAGLIMRG